MNTHPHLTNKRSALYDEFSRLQARALRSSLWPKLKGKTLRLEVFPEGALEKDPNRRFMGEQEIPLEQIVGTLNRKDDFDDQFRPLKPSLRERWVNVCMTFENEGWPPILVHKVANRYYVEDGHHRVSVARWLGMTCISARVWDYPTRANHAQKCESLPGRGRTSVPVCSGITD